MDCPLACTGDIAKHTVDDNTVFAVITSPQVGLYGKPTDYMKQQFDHHKHDNLLACQNSELIYWSELLHTEKHVATGEGGSETVRVPTLYLVHVSSSFSSPVVAVPYNVDGSDGTDPMWWLFIEPRSKWKDHFRKVMKKLIQRVRLSRRVRLSSIEQ